MSVPSAAAAPPRFALRMWVFFAGYFVFGGVSLPFLPVWLDGRGLTDTEIANVLALPLAVRVLLTPFAGVFADRLPHRRIAIQIFVVIGALAFTLAWPADTYLTLLLTVGGSAVLWGLALPVGEALTLTGVRQFGLDYGRMRLGGSFSFIVANLGSGAIVGLIATDSIYFLLMGALAVSCLVAFLLPATPPAVRRLDDAERPAPPSARMVLGHPRFLVLVLVGGLIQSSHAMLYSFGSIYWHGAGFTGAEIGAFWAGAVTCEIVMFMYSGKALRLGGPYGLIAIGGFAAIVRWTLFPLDLGFAGSLALQGLHAFTFGAVYLGNQHAIARAVPEELTASAQGVYAMVLGMLMAITTGLAGPIFETYGMDGVRFMIIPAVAGLLILGLYRFLPRRVA